MSLHQPLRGRDPQTVWLALGGMAAAAAGIWVLTRERDRNQVHFRPADDAPDHTLRGEARGGSTVTIDRPRSELFAFWRDFSNLPKFMEGVSDVSSTGDTCRWTMEGIGGRKLTFETRVMEEIPDRLIVWESTEASDVKANGTVSFADAPAGRGTEVEAVIAYVPPFGGSTLARLFRLAPKLRGRHELKRLKMLMETGEIATSRNRRT
ncbi:SRPBCC family protein [Rhodobacter sp. NSM]|uniref:SRPBCC family protein n=1 Tax=Rhodobacter sp. NSM TaxID=3457501 RepID=UPI003FD02178